MLSFHYQHFNWQAKRHFWPYLLLSSEENKDQVFYTANDAYRAESYIC